VALQVITSREASIFIDMGRTSDLVTSFNGMYVCLLALADQRILEGQAQLVRYRLAWL
jgi:hypothetical protein